MNADAFRHLYEHHFAANRMLWYFAKMLTPEQFTQPVDYSVGSVRDHIVHMMNVDSNWFTELTGVEPTVWLDAAAFDDRDAVRAQWDLIVQQMRDYLAGLRDDMLFEKPLPVEEDKHLSVWQVLLHVANHGTDHRAQVLRIIHDMGVETPPQDYAFYCYENR